MLDAATQVSMQPHLCMVDGVTLGGNAGADMHDILRHMGVMQPRLCTIDAAKQLVMK